MHMEKKKTVKNAHGEEENGERLTMPWKGSPWNVILIFPVFPSSLSSYDDTEPRFLLLTALIFLLMSAT